MNRTNKLPLGKCPACNFDQPLIPIIRVTDDDVAGIVSMLCEWPEFGPLAYWEQGNIPAEIYERYVLDFNGHRMKCLVSQDKALSGGQIADLLWTMPDPRRN